MYKSIIQNHSYRFRRFTRKAYAAFASMHRHVTIGHVANRICNLELLKAGKTMALCAAMTGSIYGYADEELSPDEQNVANEIALQQLDVVANNARLSSSTVAQLTVFTRQDIIHLPANHSLAQLLQQLPGVDVRQRGATGVQADIAINGSTADQTLIFLNGVNLTDPQTGHYSLNLPVDPQDIERIEVYNATPQGLGAFAGVINIITRQAQDTLHEFETSLAAGEYGLFNPRIAFMDANKKIKWKTNASYNQSTGFEHNTDYRIANIFARLTTKDFEVQAGTQYKDAGANAFYALAYPNQFDATRMAFASAAYHGRIATQWAIDASALYRAHYDRFELFRQGTDTPDWYTTHNHHWTHTADIDAKIAYMERYGTTSVGGTLRDAYIESNTLGLHNRLTINYYLQQTAHFPKLSLAALIGGTYNNAFAADWAYNLDVAYQPIKKLALYFNTARALRLPTFTDLYYHSATQQGNDSLKAEHAYKLEIGANYHNQWNNILLDAHFKAYYRYATDVIDWVKKPEEKQWSARNYTQLQTYGTNISVGLRAQQPLGHFLRQVRVSYAWCNTTDYKTSKPTAYLSKYALDYLQHHLALSLEHSIYKGLGASWLLSWQHRNGSYADRDGEVQDYKPVLLLDASIFYQTANWKASIDCSNITNQTYYDYGGILQPTHWLRAKITINY